MTRRILLCLFAVIAAASAMAQIPAEVKDVLKKCEDKMEYSVNENVAGYSTQVTITITKLTRGCPDNWLKLDMNRYKNAVVVRK